MKNVLIISLVFCLTACGTAYESDDATQTQKTSTAVTTKAATVTSTATTTTVAGNGVTRHLPGTLITTATGKYYYLVMSDGSAVAFATSALVTSSGYKLAQAVVVSADELWCYSKAEQINTALTAVSTGKLRDGTIVKETGKSSVYVVSDSVAWPIMNQTAFDLAGYSLSNVVEISANTLAGKVAAVGDCTLGVACLDSNYEYTCAKDETVGDLPPTGINTGTQTQSTTTTNTTSQTTVNVTQSAAATVTRHLPGTVIANGSGKYYLVNDDETISLFANASLIASSGYSANMVIQVAAAELACYGVGDPVNAALPAPPSGQLRDGMLVYETGKKDTYAISGGVAWPIKNETAFYGAGYTFAAAKELAAGSLATAVIAVGDCVSGLFCLDSVYESICVKSASAGNVTVATINTATATQTQTQTAIVQTVATSATATNTATATVSSIASASSTNTVTASATATSSSTKTATVGVTVTTTVVDTSSATATATLPTTAIATSSATSTATSTATSSATSSVTTTNNQQPTTIDLSWVYTADGSKLCLNAAYFAGSDKAVLLIWSGPGADAAKGPVVIQSNDRFCWDFMNREKGLYYFWADVPDGSCSADTCARDAIPGNGAMYMTAPKASAAAHKWLACKDTGCDGAAYWDGAAFTPMGG